MSAASAMTTARKAKTAGVSTNSTTDISFKALRALSSSLGLDVIGVLSRASAHADLSIQRTYLESWQQAGFAGEMAYMKRPAALFADLDNILPGTKSVVFFAAPYRAAQQVESRFGYGRVARYAWGRDYHSALRGRLRKLMMRLRDEVSGEFSARVFTDAVPLLERALAQRAGLGFVGKHSLLIRHGLGSYFFIGELLLDAEIVGQVEQPSVFRSSVARVRAQAEVMEPGVGCGSCQRCIDSCPTEAIVNPGVVDSRRCISYLTIEKREAHSPWESRALGDWIFGCDVCQEVCPFNATESGEEFEEFGEEHGVGPYLELSSILGMQHDEVFQQRFAGTAILRTGRGGLIRNACSVVANTRFTAAILALRQLVTGDESAVVRYQARACLENLLNDSDGIDKVRISRALS